MASFDPTLNGLLKDIQIYLSAPGWCLYFQVHCPMGIEVLKFKYSLLNSTINLILGNYMLYYIKLYI